MAGADLVLRPTTPEDIFACSAFIRGADRAECWAAAHWTPEDALWVGLQSSDPCLTALVDGVIVCIFGVLPVSILLGKVCPWLIATDALQPHTRLFLRQSREVVTGWTARYATLVNVVDARNRAAIRYLRWLGCTLDPAVPFGPEGRPFHRFTLLAVSVGVS